MTNPAGQGNIKQQPFAMRSHETPRASYETLSSQYSVKTTEAKDREERSTSPTAPPLPALPQRYAFDQGGSLPAGAQPNSRHQNAGLARNQQGSRRAGTNPYAAVSAAQTEQTTRLVRENNAALAYLEGQAGSEDHSPPHYFSKDDYENYEHRKYDIDARKNARNAELMDDEFGRTFKPRSPLQRVEASARQAQHQILRGVGPETKFDIVDGDFTVVPDARFVPYASNLPKRTTSLVRSLSKKAKAVAQRIGVGRQNSETPKINISSPVTDSFTNPGAQTHAFAEELNLLSIDEAQRRQGVASQKHVVDRPTLEPAARYPHAFKPRPTMPKAMEQSAAGPSTKATLPTKANDASRRVKVLKRETMFEDFINVPSDDSSSASSSPPPPPQHLFEPTPRPQPSARVPFADARSSDEASSPQLSYNSSHEDILRIRDANPPLPVHLDTNSRSSGQSDRRGEMVVPRKAVAVAYARHPRASVRNVSSKRDTSLPPLPAHVRASRRDTMIHPAFREQAYDQDLDVEGLFPATYSQQLDDVEERQNASTANTKRNVDDDDLLNRLRALRRGDDGEGDTEAIIDTYIDREQTSWRVHDGDAPRASGLQALAEKARKRHEVSRSPDLVEENGDSETAAVWQAMHNQMYGQDRW